MGQHAAHLWTDSRYFIQAERQLSDAWTLHKDGLPGVPTWLEWLKGLCCCRIGVDPKLVAYTQAQAIGDNLRESDCVLVHTHNLVDRIWYDRPHLPLKPLFELRVQFAGVHASQKLRSVDAYLGSKRALIATALDDVAWTLNLRWEGVCWVTH